MYASSLNFAELSENLRSGKMDLPQYVNDLCDRIEAIDAHVQSLVVEPDRRSRLLKEAEQLQQRYPEPDRRPPLYGIPVGVKDVIHSDGLPTQAGSRLPSDILTGKEAACVSMLREAGALIVGKTVTTEFANSEPGPTVNPHHIEHTPGGSSSGSAAAVAAGLCPLALGTQTVGSVIKPAAFCGVIGYKPSYGRIPKEGMIDFSPSLDHVGLFSQDLKSMKLGASLLCNDWLEVEEQSNATNSLVLGVPEGPYLSQMPSEGLALFKAQIQRLAHAGYTIKHVPAFENLDDIAIQHRKLAAREMADVHAKWFVRYESLYRPRTRAYILRGQEVSDAQWAEARDTAADTRRTLEKKMDDAGIDLWVCPSALGPAPSGIAYTGNSCMNLPWTNSGLPVVTIPVDRSHHGLPVGLQLAARYGADEHLLAWAERMNRVFGFSL